MTKEMKNKNGKEAAARYTKKQLAGSERYRNQGDLISALLEEGKLYTVAEADEALKGFMKGRVKVC